METDPLRVPVAVGLKVMLMVHFALAATLPLQLSASLKSPLFAPVTVMPEMVSVTFPVLVSVTPCAVLLVPTACVVNARLVGDKLTTGAAATPVPVIEMLCGLLAALSVNFNEALSPPMVLGVKVTLTVQVAFGATDALLQVSALMAKSAAFVPLTATAVNVRFALPVLVTVTVIAEVFAPCGWLPKGRLDGEGVKTGADGVPVPVSARLCGLFAALSVNFSDALSAPRMLGVKVSPTLQVAFGATDAVLQVFELIAKSAALVPEIASAEKVRFALPVFVTVTLMTALFTVCG